MCFKQFSNEAFRETLTNNISSEEFIHADKGLQRFCKVCIEKHTRGNQTPFMTKELLKEIEELD